MLENNIRDDILDKQFAGLQSGILFGVGGIFALSGFGALPLAPGIHPIAKFTLCQLVSPQAKSAFGIFHDIALMHQGQIAALVFEGIADGSPHQAECAFFGNGFDAKPG